ncbi:hypothetical protein NDU88_001797 [Pleurodeles waltl]|uniref:Uncharacterized protein n=1 Tax=Pleurodeles waltl TaxID=8319 RepID=A0AAV7T0Y9_PLEWA|nr:hypothetical protein NDU88_001797 [Pleurodeles waltl]
MVVIGKITEYVTLPRWWCSDSSLSCGNSHVGSDKSSDSGTVINQGEQGVRGRQYSGRRERSLNNEGYCGNHEFGEMVLKGGEQHQGTKEQEPQRRRDNGSEVRRQALRRMERHNLPLGFGEEAEKLLCHGFEPEFRLQTTLGASCKCISGVEDALTPRAA